MARQTADPSADPATQSAAGEHAPAATRTPCSQCPFQKREGFRPLNVEELSFMASFKRDERVVQAGDTVLREGESSTHLYTVLDGWGLRHKTLEDGRRQVLNYVFPGDLIGLQTTLMDDMTHTLEALSTMRLCVFDRVGLPGLIAGQPSLAYDTIWMAAREECMLENQLISVGRRTALERSAYLLASLYDRGLRSGLRREGDAINPITQTHVADALGMSLVHTNKTIRRLQDAEAVQWHGKKCRVLDREKLGRIAKWDGSEAGNRPFI